MARIIPTDKSEHWVQEIARYDREFKKWEQRVDKIIRRYRDEPMNNRGYNLTKFNILWSNVQTALPAVFARLPKPDVSRRFKDNDPVGRVASLILERALTYEVEHYPEYRASLNECVLDRFLGGRGTAWVRYEPHIATIDSPEEGVSITEDIEYEESEQHEAEENELGEEIEYECSPVDYVHWKEFGHTIARTWEEVTAVWRKVYLSRDALIERFGEEIAYKVPLDSKPDNNQKLDTQQENNQACVYEIWDKSTGKAYWLSKSLGKIIDEKDDPLDLENFWPCPKPLFATLTNESLIPVPDFALYQDQANTLDLICDRIDGLVRALQVKGGYDASIPELKRIFTEGENNTLIPINNWMSFAEKNGLQGSISLIDLQPIYQALTASYQAMEQQKAQIFEITGLSDIIRGQSAASETATAQQLKGQYASMRLKSMQDDVSMFASELLKIKAQIICKHYQPETIIKIGGAAELSQNDQQYVPQAIQLLKTEDLYAFRIDVEADSMVMMDEQQEKQNRMEFLQAAGGFLKEAVIACQQAPELAPLAMEMLKFGVAGFRAGKTIEGEFNSTADMLKQKAAQPPVDPNAAKVQADQQKAQMETQAEMAKHQSEMQQRQQEQVMQAQIEQHRNEMEAQRQQAEYQSQMMIEHMKQQNARDMEMMRMQFEDAKARMDNEVKLMIAELGAKTQLTIQQDKAAEQALNETGE